MPKATHEIKISSAISATKNGTNRMESFAKTQFKLQKATMEVREASYLVTSRKLKNNQVLVLEAFIEGYCLGDSDGTAA